MEYRKQAKAAMNEKISRMTAPLKGAVDASGFFGAVAGAPAGFSAAPAAAAPAMPGLPSFLG